MAQESPNRMVEWYLALRAWLPVARRGVANWLAQVRAEPALIWESLAVRYTAGGIAALVVVWLISTVINLATIPPPADAQPPSDKAYFHVMCSDPACRHQFTTYQPKRFDDFPIVCAKCGKRTGEHARQCFSRACGGRWVVPQPRETGPVCPSCGQPL